MKIRKQEIATLLAGVALDQTLVHWSFGLGDMLPLHFPFYTLTTSLNTAAMVAWPLLAMLAMLLIYYAWFRQPRP